MHRVIVLWVLLIGLAGWLVRQHRLEVDPPRGRARAMWFALWALAGFLTSFSAATGLSIGLLVLPAAAVSLLWVARRAPHYPEALGFLLGIGVTVLVITAVQASG
jgi:hypothetical protein